MALSDYSEDQLFSALRNADSAGDTEGARRIAGMIQQKRTLSSVENKETDWVDDVKYGVKEAGKSVAQAGVNTANIIPEVGDSIVSAAAWAGEKIGLGDGTYTPAMRFSLPEDMKPETTGGKIASEVIPYLVPAMGPEKAAAALGTAADAGRLERGAARAADLAQENIIGALAQNSHKNDAESLSGDLTMGMAAGGVAKMALPLIGKAYGAISGKVNNLLGKSASPSDISSRSADSLIDEVTQGAAKATDSKLIRGNQKEIEAFAREVIPDQQVLSAAKNIGMEDVLTPGMYSLNPGYRAFENALSSTPGNKAYHARRDVIERLGVEADKFISTFGGDIDKQFVNAATKNRYTNLRDGLKAEENALYREVNNAIPKRSTIDTSATMKAIEDFSDDVGGLESMKKLFPEASKPLELLDPNTMPTYGRLDRVRMMIGDALGKAGKNNPFSNMKESDLKNLYSAISQDQEAAAMKFGAGEIWNAAKGVARQRFAVQDAMISNLGKNTDKGIVEQVQKSIVDMSQGKGGGFRELVANLPDDAVQNVVVTALNKAFTSYAKSPGQALGVDGFVKWYNGMLRNKSNMQSLSRAIGYDASRRLRNLYDVAKGINRQNTERVYSATQIDKAMAKYAGEGGLLSKLYGIGKKVAVAEGATSTVGLPGSGTMGVLFGLLGKGKSSRIQAADELITSSAFKNISKIAISKETTAQQRRLMNNALLKLPQYRKWLSTLPKEEADRVTKAGVLSFMFDED